MYCYQGRVEQVLFLKPKRRWPADKIVKLAEGHANVFVSQ